MKEIWKDIPNYEGYYQVSNFGNVRSCDRDVYFNNGYSGGMAKKKGKIKEPSILKNGYLKVSLHKCGVSKNVLVHRAVLFAFIGEDKEKPYVNHKNFDKTDNRLSNLEWCTPLENVLHSVKNNRVNFANGEKHGNSKLTKEQVDYIKKNPNKISQKKLAIEFNVCQPTISKILNNKRRANG